MLSFPGEAGNGHRTAFVTRHLVETAIVSVRSGPT